jgi:cysteinyl-tRNA synthetase
MTLRFYNSASRKKEVFNPIKEGKASIYVCGPTVYDLCHIGNARSFLAFDVLVRYLRARGVDVTYVRNFTDVDDKIIERAKQLGKDPSTLALEFIDAFYEDMGRLGVIKADIEPRATEHINDMVSMIQELEVRGFAYEKDGDVFFSVEKLNDYGTLSGRKLEDMKAGSRIAVNEKKRHPMDFVLWKNTKPGEPCWPSPWGPGRPGWHIECSVMSNHYLGSTFDIHGGGEDLIFPHHENERAQSVAANGTEFARYWLHNGYLTVESEKMSKSLGNFITARDAMKEYPPEVIRLFLLSKHYRSPLDFSKKDLLGVQSGLVRIYRTLQRLEKIAGKPEVIEEDLIENILPDEQEDTFLKNFVYSMDDDLNTSGAIGLIFDKVKDMNRLMDTLNESSDIEVLNRLKKDRHNLLKAARVLGVLNESPAAFFETISQTSDAIDDEEIEKLIRERVDARAAKDWARADSIRDELKEKGVILEDSSGETTWRYEV